ncbi:hypothetical protein [Mucisphaera sp.]|uniref:hypothetical protein n=1 Tax=Mucisphaera sp. TaxID=2913024 RepID=UPI003D0BDA02
MNGTPDYIVDIEGLRPVGDEAAREAEPRRRWIAVFWKCCSTYSRVYLNRGGEAYEGGCPRCGSRVRAVIGPEGTATRFFEAE